MENRLCCSFEAEVMFYVYFKKDSRSSFHSKAYFVQHYNGNKNILGHLPRKEAEAVDDLFTIPMGKLSGCDTYLTTCIYILSLVT